MQQVCTYARSRVHPRYSRPSRRLKIANSQNKAGYGVRARGDARKGGADATSNKGGAPPLPPYPPCLKCCAVFVLCVISLFSFCSYKKNSLLPNLAHCSSAVASLSLLSVTRSRTSWSISSSSSRAGPPNQPASGSGHRCQVRPGL